ncbi:MAG: hypothetical protein HF314_06800 [Ignavibacteria bacterium]|nr:hypothetical protein [Ignavibacteria bacterium]MCU7502764.1 hypothetical protein [Ignavibacteria bacterium]MCU7518200.1 hypothetical protein [Ignavibacteria bacterium]
MRFLIDNNSDAAFLRKSRKLITAGMILSSFLLSSGSLMAQWNNNPQVNRILVSNVKNPYNITASPDQSGGGFLFWEDKVDTTHTNVFFQHYNENGQVSFRTDGKPVSLSQSSRSFPVSCTSLQNSAVVFFKDFSDGKAGELYAQKVSSKGDLLWGSKGIRVTYQDAGILELSAAGDNEANTFVTYIYRNYGTPADYIIYVQKLNPSGKTSFRGNGVTIIKSPSIKSRPRIAPDNRGGAYIFWIESNEGKARLYSQHITSSGRTSWSSRPLLVSTGGENVINYVAEPVASSAVYAAWEIKRSGRDILHQLISSDGKLLWNKNGERITGRYGDQTSPQPLCSDSSITLTWVNEALGDKDIFIQKYNLKGQAQWAKDGLPVIQTKGSQMSQRIIGDHSSGMIVTWLDKRSKTQRGNILAQRIDKNGRKLWDSLGVALASYANSEKSYLNILPSVGKSVVALFKETRNGQNGIFGQRILSNGKYSYEVSGFSATVDNNLVRTSWQSNNEQFNKGYYVERSTGSDTSWQRIKFIESKKLKGISTYEFSEKTPSSPEVYYRLVQVDNDGDEQKSAPVKLNFFNYNADSYALSQNFPNPFADSTTIKYYLPQDCNVTLEIYSDKIESISVPVNAFQTKGEHSYTFHAEGSYGRLPGGVYFYRLKAGEFVEVKKMIIVR